MLEKILEKHGARLLVDPEKMRWVLNTSDEVIYLDSLCSEKLISALWILESTPSYVESKLGALELDPKQKAGIMQNFPIDKLVMLCIENKSQYWLEKALAWVCVFKLSRKVQITLAEQANNKYFPQSLRHDIRRTISKIKPNF